MGSGSSRLGSSSSRAAVHSSRRPRLFSSLICGGGSSSRSAVEMEEYPDETLVNSAECCNPVINKVWNPLEESSLVSGTVTGSGSCETRVSSESCITASDGTFVEEGSKNLETSNQGKCLAETESNEFVAPYQVSINYRHDETYRTRSSSEASTSFKEQQSSAPASVNVSANMDKVNGIDNSENNGVSQICPEIIHSSSSSPQGLGGSHYDRVSAEDHIGEVTAILNSDSNSIPSRSDVPVTFHSLGDESMQEAMPSDLGILVPNGERGQGEGSVLHLDVVSISPSIFSSNNTDTNSREARRNSRRLFWDAFSRRSSRRHIDSPTIVFSTDNTDDLVSHDRWLLDFSSDFFDDGIGNDSGYLGSRIHRLHERRRQSRSEIRERLRSGLDENSHTSTSCPSGLHLDGSCSCESFMTSEESSTHASISRIVMLAEALFEVLDEIHRQPVSLALSMMSLPAPESVVDSLPLKNHKKVDKVEANDDSEQCYICLAEYEEGDKIRVLPCHHEYHMSCVDKWLKEIHGVCPLCRGDVRQAASQPSVPNPEVSSS